MTNTTAPQVLMIGTDYHRRAEIEATAHASGAALAVVDVAAAREHYGTTRLVLVGENAGEAVAKANLVAGDGCLVVLLAEVHDTPTWELAIATNADYVCDLAEAGALSWLMGKMLYASGGQPFVRPTDADA